MRYFLLLVFFSICRGEEKILSFPLKRVDSPFVAMLKQNIHPRIIEKMIKPYEVDANDTIPIALRKFFDYEFYANISIGKPKQRDRFNLIFDTTWGDSWVPSANCTPVGTCKYRHKYEGTNGTNTKQKFSIPGAFQGVIWKDDIFLNTKNITNQYFGVVENFPPNLFFLSKADGVIGMAMSSTFIKNSKPILSSIKNQGFIKNLIFSVYINRDKSSTRAGTVFIGGVEKRHYAGNFTYVTALPTSNLWTFKMESITIGKTFKACANGCDVIVDTGSSQIEGPEGEIDGINQFIGAQYFAGGRYSVSCVNINRYPAITFNIGGRKFLLKGRHYIQEVDLGFVKMCLTNFKAKPGTSWSIGASFISAYYTTFDLENRKIGFATSL